MHVVEWSDRIGLVLQTDDSVNDGTDEKVVTTREEFGCRFHSDFVMMRFRS
jgi:hypothetical protein